MLPNYQPLCPTTGLVNLFSTFSGVTKYISKALPLISGEYAAVKSQVPIMGSATYSPATTPQPRSGEKPSTSL